jgi:hypothetical protein
VLLIMGVFAMLYIRERRLWVWLAPAGADGSRDRMALSSNRQARWTPTRVRGHCASPAAPAPQGAQA